MEAAAQFSLDSAFVWVVLLSTLGGLILSFTRVRNLESAGASKVGTVFLYFLIACIGMQMDLAALADRPMLFLLGVILGLGIIASALMFDRRTRAREERGHR